MTYKGSESSESEFGDGD